MRSHGRHRNRRGLSLAIGTGAVAVAAWTGCGSDELPPTTVAIADSADQIIFGLRHHLTFEGLRRAKLEADTAYYYEASQTIELRTLTVTFYSYVGAETSTLTAREGTYYWRTGYMQARGNVVAVTPDGRRLTTSVLEYNRNTNQIVGPETFLFINAEQRIEGDAFTSDPDFRNVVTTRPRGAVGQVEIERQ